MLSGVDAPRAPISSSPSVVCDEVTLLDEEEFAGVSTTDLAGGGGGSRQRSGIRSAITDLAGGGDQQRRTGRVAKKSDLFDLNQIFLI